MRKCCPALLKLTTLQHPSFTSQQLLPVFVTAKSLVGDPASVSSEGTDWSDCTLTD